MKQVKYVQLEPAAIVCDSDFRRMNAEQRGAYLAIILDLYCNNSKQIHIGYYDYEQDAAIAYDDMAIELFGEFAYLNFAHRPELEQWLEQSYLFETNNFVAISNEQQSTVCQTIGR